MTQPVIHIQEAHGQARLDSRPSQLWSISPVTLRTRAADRHRGRACTGGRHSRAPDPAVCPRCSESGGSFPCPAACAHLSHSSPLGPELEVSRLWQARGSLPAPAFLLCRSPRSVSALPSPCPSPTLNSSVPLIDCPAALRKSHLLAWLLGAVGTSSQTPEGQRFDSGSGTHPGCGFHPVGVRTGGS